jgi:hypothetical protein
MSLFYFVGGSMSLSRFEELTLKEVIDLYSRYKRAMAISAALLLGIALIFHFTQNLHVSRGSIVVNDSQNSSLQAFSTSFTGFSKSLIDGKKGNSVLSKHFEYLKSRDYLEQVAMQLIANKDDKALSLDEMQGAQKIVSRFDGQANDAQIRSLAAELNNSLNYKLLSDFEIGLKVKDKDAAVATYVAKVALSVAVRALSDRESADLHKVEELIAKQKNDADAEIKRLAEELGQFHDRPQVLLSVTSKDKMGDYVSELMVRANEIKLKLAENNRMISDLKKSQREEGSSLYGIGGRIEALKFESKNLSSRLIEVQSSLSRLSASMKSLPVVSQKIDDLKRKSEIEYSKYKEASTALAKIETSKLSLSSKYEIFEMPSKETTGFQFSLTLLMGSALLLSQLLVLMFIVSQTQFLSPDPEPDHNRRLIFIREAGDDGRFVPLMKPKVRISFDNQGSSGSQMKKKGISLFRRPEPPAKES